MSTIKVSDLQPTGFDLFSDSESYMRELSSEEVLFAKGGSTILCRGAVVVGTYILDKEVIEPLYDYAKQEAKELIKEAGDYISKTTEQIAEYMMFGS